MPKEFAFNIKQKPTLYYYFKARFFVFDIKKNCKLSKTFKIEHSKMRFILFLLMFIFSTTSFSTEIENLHFVINNNFQKSFNINPTYIQSIPENDNSELITSIIKTDENWKRLLSVEKGFTNEKFLLKIPIKNKQENKQFTLLLDWHYIDFATLYYKNKLGEIKEVSTLGEFTKKKRNISFPITIDKDETIDFYIKVNSTGHVRLPIHLFTEEYYSQRENLHNIIYGAFIGIMILIMIHNIIAFTKLKLKLFVPYILFIFFEVFFGSILTGHISQQSKTYSNLFKCVFNLPACLYEHVRFHRLSRLVYCRISKSVDKIVTVL